MLHLTLTDPHDANLIRKYGIEKCHIKHLTLGRMVFACTYRGGTFMVGNRDEVCIPTCLTMPSSFTSVYSIIGSCCHTPPLSRLGTGTLAALHSCARGS